MKRLLTEIFTQTDMKRKQYFLLDIAFDKASRNYAQKKQKTHETKQLRKKYSIINDGL